MTQHIDIGEYRRGDSIYIDVNDVLSAAGVAIVLSDYTLRATLKLATDVATTDTAALSSVTSGAGITVSGNDATVKFPASATTGLTTPQRLVGDVQATKTADSTEVRTLLSFTVDIVMDSTKVSP